MLKKFIDELSELYRKENEGLSILHKTKYSIMDKLDNSENNTEPMSYRKHKEAENELEEIIKKISNKEQYAKGIFMSREVLMDRYFKEEG